MKNGIFVLVFLASALTRIFLLGSAPERLVKSLGQDLTCAVFSDQNYENENGNQYDLYIPAGLDRTQDQNLILYIHGVASTPVQKLMAKHGADTMPHRGTLQHPWITLCRCTEKMRPFIR